MLKAIALLSLALAAFVPRATLAADVPTYAVDGQETIEGTISAITGKYSLTLSDRRGFLDRIVLHDGTVITPTGLRLGAGQTATIIGRADGKTFEAYEIDVDPSSISDYSSDSVGGYPYYGGATYPLYASPYGSYGPYGGYGYNNGYYSPYGYNAPYGYYGSYGYNGPYAPNYYGPGYFYTPAQPPAGNATPVTPNLPRPIVHQPIRPGFVYPQPTTTHVEPPSQSTSTHAAPAKAPTTHATTSRR